MLKINKKKVDLFKKLINIQRDKIYQYALNSSRLIQMGYQTDTDEFKKKMKELSKETCIGSEDIMNMDLLLNVKFFCPNCGLDNESTVLIERGDLEFRDGLTYFEVKAKTYVHCEGDCCNSKFKVVPPIFKRRKTNY